MNQTKNAIVLGCSSGYGKAITTELADKGYNIYGAHLDMGKAKIAVEEFRQSIEAKGVKAVFFNMNAADEKNRAKIMESIKESGNAGVDVFVHSLAFGAIGPFFTKNREEEISPRKMEMTFNIMASSLLYWCQDLFHADLFRKGARIFAMSSSGSTRVMVNYGGISVAKAALEAYIRQIAWELAPYDITANTILAGVCDTPAGRKIPTFDGLLRYLRYQSPFKRNTQAQDVARAIGLLCDPNSYWITGQVINVDGGENLGNQYSFLEDQNVNEK
jgi:enoyl-[acyl-carrier-protein] reductase (NADH)